MMCRAYRAPWINKPVTGSLEVVEECREFGKLSIECKYDVARAVAVDPKTIDKAFFENTFDNTLERFFHNSDPVTTEHRISGYN